MSGKLIATIYFYIISAGSLILIVIGIFNIVNFIINSTQYDKYPPRYFGPTGSCESMPYKYGGGPSPVMIDAKGMPATSSAQETEKQKKDCMAQEDLDRKQHKIDDIKNSITFSLVGFVLFLIHFPLARKQSNN